MFLSKCNEESSNQAIFQIYTLAHRFLGKWCTFRNCFNNRKCAEDYPGGPMSVCFKSDYFTPRSKSLTWNIYTFSSGCNVLAFYVLYVFIHANSEWLTITSINS